MDSSESGAVNSTPCSPFNLSACFPSATSSSGNSSCNSCSYSRHYHQRRKSRRAPTTNTCNSSDDRNIALTQDTGLNLDGRESSSIINNNLTATTSASMMRLNGTSGEEKNSLNQVIMSNCPCDLMSRETAQEEDGDPMGNMSIRRKRRVHRSISSSFFPSSTFSRTALWFTFLSVALLTGTGEVDGLRMNQFGGYEDIVVSVGTDVPPITCQQLVQNLQVCRNFFTTFSSYPVSYDLSTHILAS